jgi:hypothetical protein
MESIKNNITYYNKALNILEMDASNKAILNCLKDGADINYLFKEKTKLRDLSYGKCIEKNSFKTV